MDATEYAEFRNTVREMMAEVNTTLPAQIVEYDATTRIATVRPSLDKKTADGRAIKAPLIYDVEVRWTSARSVGAIISLPLNPGDGGMLHFCQRSLDAWLDGGRLPDDPRQFDLNDAFFVPGVDRRSELVPAEANCMLIKIGAAIIRMYEDGHAVVTLPNGYRIEAPLTTITGNLQVDGGIHSDGDTVAGATSLKTHVHSGVQGGPSNTGAPTK